MNKYDTIIIGAGAAGLKAAGVLATRKKSILILDMGDEPARKVAVSGGGNCNFTNLAANANRYFGKNPNFVKSALAQWTPQNTLDLVKSNHIETYEKEPGRYFCKNSAEAIINTLMKDIKNTEIKYNTEVQEIIKNGDIFNIKTNNGMYQSLYVIIATGGVSYPHLGVSNIGHIIAKQFGHKIEPIRPTLCAVKTKKFNTELAGISLPVEIKIEKKIIADDLLFTHFGIGGPAVYRATMYGNHNWKINFAPNTNVFELLKKAKLTSGKKLVANILSNILPNKLAHFLCNDKRNIADLRDTELKQIADSVNNFEIKDITPIGFQSAEVTMGGISTEHISSKTMESKLCSGLFFAGEVMDITGDLGGFNLQWAFSSGYVAGLNA